MAVPETEATSWLALLERECSAHELAAFHRRLTGSGTVDPDDADHEFGSALHVLARLDERRRQAERLTVLNDLARRLTVMHDPADVLQEVAGQARRLLGVDVAYIMLLREDGTLRIEVVDGTLGTGMRGIELAPGVGLGGEVLRTGRPIWSPDYLADHAFPHASPVDEAAAGERLNGILGVPLVVGEDTIGVLLAADRRVRAYSDGDVELLAALAGQAAVAIRNASLFEQRRIAVEELEQANRSLERAAEARTRAAALTQDLTGLVVHGGGLQEVARRLARATGCSVAVFDAEDLPAAGDVGAPLPPPEVRAALGDRRSGAVAVHAADGPAGPAVFAPVALPDGYAGCVVAWAGPTDDRTTALLPIGASTVALVIASERSVAEAELRTRGEFVAALLSPDVDEASIRRRARSARIDLDRVSAVAVLRPAPDEHARCVRAAGQLADALDGWVAEHADDVVLLLSGPTPDQVRRRLAAPDGPVPATAGVSACAGGAAEVRLAHERARQTVAVLLGLGRAGAVATDVELGVYRSLFSSAGREEITAFVQARIGPLLDDARGADLARTLQVYLDQFRHHARTCALLHVHPNTLYQRLHRIDRLLEAGSLEEGRAVEVQLALRLHALAGSVDIRP
jgi:hypothetical protein